MVVNKMTDFTLAEKYGGILKVAQNNNHGYYTIELVVFMVFIQKT